MPVGFNIAVPPPSLVISDEEAWDLLHLLLKRNELYPEEPFGFDTETSGLQIPLKEVEKHNPLDWMNDTVILWSLSARLDGETLEDWYNYTVKWHPDHFVYADGSEADLNPYGKFCLKIEHLHIFVGLFENPKVRLALWNAKYDAHVMWNTGFYIWLAQIWDIMNCGYLIDENLQGSMGLKDRAPEWAGINMTKFKDLFSGVTLPDGNKPVEYVTDLRVLMNLSTELAYKVAVYASDDAFATLKLAEYVKEKLEAIPMGGYQIDDEWQQGKRREGVRSMWEYFLQIEVPMCEVLWRMERRGLLIDREMLTEVGPGILAEQKQVETSVNRMAGRYVNVNAAAQVSALFFGTKLEGFGLKPLKMTKGGRSMPKPSADVEVLEELCSSSKKEVRDLAQAILRVRKLAKMHSTYILNIDKLTAHFNDHRLHPSFNQYGARTGRFSTTNPNSQNFPNPKGDEFGIRKMFIARPGWRLIVGDYEQLEMRIMAHMSRDVRMVKAILGGMDLHCYTVSVMYNVPYEEVIAAKKSKEPNERQLWLVKLRGDCKAVGFGIIYGAGAPTIASQIGSSKEEAQEKITGYFNAFPGVAQYIDETHANCKERGYVTTIAGRRRRLEASIRSPAFLIRSHAEREAVNSTIQGSAADIVKFAMLCVEYDRDLNRMPVCMINQIHDELVFEAPAVACEEAMGKIKYYMEKPFNGKDPLIVPTPVDLKVVDRWNEAK